MNPDIPGDINIMFLILVVVLLILLLSAIRKIFASNVRGKNNQQRIFMVIIFGILTWLGLTTTLSLKGFFLDFDAIPPKFPIAILPPTIFILLLGFSKKLNALLRSVPQTWLIYPQCFRIFMEIILWRLFISGIIPVQMTFEGYNFDILVGITALFAGWYLQKKDKSAYNLIIIWNIAGLILLTIIVTIAVLSVPTPFRQFMTEPANTIVGYWPWIWLPSFVVMFALLLHVLSIKQMHLAKKEAK